MCRKRPYRSDTKNGIRMKAQKVHVSSNSKNSKIKAMSEKKVYNLQCFAETDILKSKVAFQNWSMVIVKTYHT